MLVREILDSANEPVFSFEFFPPKKDTEWETLFDTIANLNHLHPSYVSVTYGAGGSTRSRTHDLVTRIQKDTGLTVVSHLTCICSDMTDTVSILENYLEHGITNVLALRGDKPAGIATLDEAIKDFPHAIDLVRFIKKRFPSIGIGIAGFPEGHPETPNRLKEIEYLKEKVDAGADYIVTQLFFDNRDYFDFVDRCRIAGINVPVIPGIMPVTTKRGMIRMSELALGARIPAPLMKRVLDAVSDDDVAKTGIEWAAAQVQELIDRKVKGIHFYTLNLADATMKIFETIGKR
ncbi:MAG: methylenetetrahydrofolate reductase [NAD(P)H] [Chlorobium sp.]|uniref:methylenetetrahydrofolate reductase [NAD(P)H] n=1 Tax=Chlorobium sp. TaxID=1095 RepID=UPI0025BA8D18|nr:methylenetetrahydrofolate reductase [NAD(P)H] [Chlorobium sp.]MCF8215690.1 methylenetetrahydrofolate reductase [NAD(P)H] [Chlorobium sp.]MCF8270576.1 methylenetetrahydrofolate reductase [NAD(P)H] [Chlorobium sp.]MCF8286899.1 methylenetetrahydrofolate reductase [NAD(P)H] [Chlorobium sp.]MCF8290495.1 methylenetetrahydrofolate reductase [NAD(P)H] [Chlorobium sp.]MCF8384581.1 methylenetetrahydrofolate reductase [NAD(P)H] [Chlorobium sp.]